MNSATQPPPPDDAWLEKVLRDQESNYIDDAGFAARVVHALPARQIPQSVRRSMLLVGATVLGCSVAAWFGSAALGELLTRQLEPIASFSAVVPSWPSYALLGATAVLAIVTTWRVWVQSR